MSYYEGQKVVRVCMYDFIQYQLFEYLISIKYVKNVEAMNQRK